MSESSADPSIPRTVQPSPPHDRLDVFVGRWRTEGRQVGGTIGAEAPIVAEDRYEWLNGHRFLIHRFTGRVGDADASCVEIIGYDEEREVYPVHTFYNAGNTNRWEYRVDGLTWTLTGEWSASGKTTPVRCTLEISAHGKTMKGTWQQSTDGGKGWETFWEVHSQRVD